MATTAGYSNSSLPGAVEDREDSFGDPEWQAWARDSFSSTSSSRFFDADSDVGSFKSAASSSHSGEGSPEVSRGSKVFLNKQLLEWKERYEEERARRLEIEDGAVKNAEELTEASKRILGLEQGVAHEHAQAQRLRAQLQAADQHAQGGREDNERVLVARLVGAIVARVISQHEAEKKWSAEVHVLRQRLERAAVMAGMVKEIQEKDKARQAEEWQRYLRVSTVVACCGVAVVGLSLATRQFRRTGASL